jgi:hypothetical protein
MKLSYVPIAAIHVALLLPECLPAQITGPIAPAAARTPVQVANRSAQLIGPYNQSQKLRIVFGLKPSKQEEEQAFLEALYTSGSPEYHHFLTAKEWNDRFAPSIADEQAVVDWVASRGLTVTHRYPNRLLVDAEGPVSQIQTALGVTINRYKLNGAAVFSNDRDPVIPASLSGIVLSVMGLNSIQVMHRHSNAGREMIHPDYSEGPAAALVAHGQADGDRPRLAAAKAAKKTDGAQPAFTNGLYDPVDIYGSNAYDFDALYNLGHCCNPNHVPGGTPPETSIAIATAGAQQLSDMQGFHNTFPYLAYNITYINIDGTPTCCDIEGTMDAEWSTAMANSFGATDDTAHVYVYQGVNSLLSTFSDIYNHMLTDGHARVMSVSWGCAEIVCATSDLMDSQNAIFNAMSAQGWTLVADADDKGSTADCQHTLVEFPASSPNIIAAGGTELHLNSDSTYNGEIAWTGNTFPGACAQNEGGGGGGFSSKWPVPAYQAFLGHGVRTLPDISMNANFAKTPQAIFFDGAISGNGGTSIVTPEFAGFIAQENAYLLYLQSLIGAHCFGNQACSPIGNANYYIYLEQQHAPAYAPHYPFYDITVGCNSNDISLNNSLAPFYCAGPGYDVVTGLGSANMLQLAWAINYSAAGDFGPPEGKFFGPNTNAWYKTDQVVNLSFSDTTLSNRPATGVAGFSVGWDADPAPESFSKSTPGSGDAFYSGPEFPGQLRGALVLSQAGQGCHTAQAKAWDNTGTSTGLLSYGPICYDTVAPITTATLGGTMSGGAFLSNVKVTLTAVDVSSGVATRFYSLDGATTVPYSAPFTVSGTGTHTLQYHSTDVAGNTESVRTRTFTIKPSPSATTISASLNPSTVGRNITFTAKVIPTAGPVPTGTVTFKDGSAVLGMAALSGGHASFATNALVAGSHVITAVYGGSNSDLASTSASLTEAVNKAATTTALISSLNPSSYWTPVTFTVTVASAFGGMAGGTVTFKDGATTLGTVNVSSNKAAFTTQTLPAGSHGITAIYSGGPNRTSSTSALLTEIVNRAATKTALVSSLNPSGYWKAVTFTATVSSAFGGQAGGTVTFRDGPTTLGTVNVTSNKATFTTQALLAGTHTITAIYSGGANRIGSTSAAFTETVNKASTTTTLTSLLNPSTSGKPVAFTATIVSAFGGQAGGTVTFKDGATTLGIVNVNSATNKATFSTSALVPGKHSITALYSGGPNRTGSTSAALTETVNKAAASATSSLDANFPSP